MSRGASNVHRGSFNATASNQASWIIMLIRRDVARSAIDRVKFKPDNGTKWTGSGGEFSITVSGVGKVVYSVEKRGGGKAFCRTEPGGSKIFLATEFLSEVTIELINNCFNVSMLLKDPSNKAKDFKWNARIYAPVPAGIDRFWKPVSEI
jgi:hypothetical protein